MNISNPEILVFVFAGLFTMGAAIADWEWFMQHPRSVFWVKLFGRSGARTFYFYSAQSSPCWRFSFADTPSICVDKPGTELHSQNLLLKQKLSGMA